MLGQICLVIGALMFAGGVIGIGQGSLSAMLIVTIALVLGSLVARSSLLAALAVLAMSACLGARTGYSHAMYSLAIFEPTLTVVIVHGSGVRRLSGLQNELSADYERIATTAARTSILLVNFGFWVGSLWGDSLILLRGIKSRTRRCYLNNTDDFGRRFQHRLGAGADRGGGVGGARNRRWLVNIASAFGAIHFYTQWFERLGATPAVDPARRPANAGDRAGAVGLQQARDRRRGLITRSAPIGDMTCLVC